VTDEPNKPIDELQDAVPCEAAEADALPAGAESAGEAESCEAAEPAPAQPEVAGSEPQTEPETAQSGAGEEPASSEAETAPLVAEPPATEAAAPEVPAAEPAAAEPAEAEVAPVPAAAEAEPDSEAAPVVAEPKAQPAVEKKRKSKKKTVKRSAAGARESEEPEKPPEPKSEDMNWYILKVQSNREDSIREGLQRRVAIAGLEYYFGDVIVPTEKVTEFKSGKKRVVKRKLYPGYLVVQMEITDDTWFLVRETPGIGDFTGAAGHPSPMLPHEVARILAKKEEKTDEAPKLKIGFRSGDRVKITEGTFENFEGEVSAIDETNGRVTVMINIFGRSTPVELEYWQIEAL